MSCVIIFWSPFCLFPPPPVPTVELIDNDGVPLESHWHVAQIPLLLDLVYCMFAHRQDFYAGGNQFIYFDEQQARKRNYRGPDSRRNRP